MAPLQVGQFCNWEQTRAVLATSLLSKVQVLCLAWLGATWGNLGAYNLKARVSVAKMGMKVLLLILLGLFLPSSGFFDNFELEFHPAIRDSYQEITADFSVVGELSDGDSVHIQMPGFSTGDCKGTRGPNIDQGSFLLWDPAEWLGGWTEGDPEDMFASSFLQLTARKVYASQTALQVTVDAQNKIRACIPFEGSTWFAAQGKTMNFSAWSDSADAKAISGSASAASYGISDIYLGNYVNHRQELDTVEAISGSGAVTSASLSWGVSGGAMVQNRDTGPVLTADQGTTIVVKFTSSVTMHRSSVIQVALPGFTTSQDFVSRSTGANIATVVVHSPSRYNYNGAQGSHPLFSASWTQGAPSSAIAARPYGSNYAWGGAVLSLTPLRFLPANHEYTVIVHHSNGIRTPCPIITDSAKFFIRISRTYRPTFSTEWTLFSQVQSLGATCVNDCSGHGKCVVDEELCYPRCECEPGYGGSDDGRACSTLMCPLGPVPGLSMRRANRTDRGPTTEDGRTGAECSAAGVCDRLTGLCACLPGYSGVACEMRSCGAQEEAVCSGHGRCASMRVMALAEDAMPLTNVERSSLLYSAVASANHKGEDESEGMGYRAAAWDADFIYGCVCDSSWPVGLGVNQTQIPEWFGPDCSLRHCPSGNDPMTPEDETDCFGVTQSGNKSPGTRGNKCYVECSNRGNCDHTNGVCSCFPGFAGANCDTPLYNLEKSEAEVTITMEG